MNQRILLFLSLLFAATAILAQRPGGGGRPGGQRDKTPYAQRPAIGTLTGTVIDSVTQKPIPYATVALALMRGDSVVAGALTDEKGKFSLKEIRSAAYSLKIQSMAHSERRINRIMISPREPMKDLGKIILTQKDYAMEEVEIVGDKPFMEMAIDRKIYNTEKLLTAQGGVATDLLQNIPSVEVDIDGNISLRGSNNVTILIDGRPSGLTGADRSAILEQIPATSIERIEVITNPSAKYDPDGMSGIINVILKRNRRLGLNGNLTLSASTQGTPARSPDFLAPNKYNTSLGLNFRNSNVNVYVNGSYRNDERFGYGENYRENKFKGPSAILEQNSNSLRSGASAMIRGGLDYYLNSKNTISFSSTFSDRGRGEEEAEIFNFKSLSGALDSSYVREADESNSRGSFDANVNYESKFDQKGRHKLVTSLSYSHGFGDSDNKFANIYLNELGAPISDPVNRQNNTRLSANHIYIIQADYEKPLKKKGKLEAGYKSIIRDINDDFTSESFDVFTDAFLPDIFLNNNFLYKERIHAAYATVGQQFKRIGYQAGVRAEQTFTTSELVNTNEEFENDYFNFFPSGFLTYKMTESQQLQLSYSRRINRPRTRQLNPFANYSDPLNLRFGNPFLLPEFVDAIEFSYAFTKNRNTVTASAYYRVVHDVIQRFKSIDTVTNVATTTYLNLGTGTSYGVELIYVGQVTKWFNLNVSFNFYRTEIDGGDTEINNSGYGYGGRFNGTFKLPKDFSIQLSSFYRGPRPTLQGRFYGFNSINLAVQKRVLDNKGTLSLNVRDLFNTMQFQVDIDDALFYQEFLRKRESRMATLTFSYRFGKQQFDTRGRRRGRGDSGGGDGGGIDEDF